MDQQKRVRGFGIQNQTRGCEAKFGLEAVTHDAKADEDQKNAVFKVVNTDNFEKFAALDFISQMSLNSVTVVVDGVMTVETLTIAAQLNAVTFDKDADCEASAPCFWTDVLSAEGLRFGTIEGAYLTGGEVEILNANELGITEVKTVSEGSSDQELHFSFKVTKPIPSQTILKVRVTKPQQGDTDPPRRVISLTRDVPINFDKVPPTIISATRVGKSVTVMGTGFSELPPNFLRAVRLLDADGEEVEATLDEARDNRLKLTIQADPKPADRFTVEVTVGAFAPVIRTVTVTPAQ